MTVVDARLGDADAGIPALSGSISGIARGRPAGSVGIVPGGFRSPGS